MSKKKHVLTFLQIVLGFIAPCIVIDVADESPFRNFVFSFKGFDLLHVLILFGIIALVLYSQHILHREKPDYGIAVLAVVFSLLQIVGYSFDKIDSWQLAFNVSDGQIAKTVFKVAGYSIIAYHVIGLVLAFLNRVQISQKDASCPPQKVFDRHTFWMTFGILAILYIPYVIASYPITFQGDAPSILFASYKEAPGQYYLNDLIPLPYCFLVRLFLEAGVLLFGSAIAGLFVLSAFQCLCMMLTVSHIVAVLKKNFQIKNWFLYMTIAFYGLLPISQNYLFLMSKDTLYATFLIGFGLQLYFIVSEKVSVGRCLKAAGFGIGMFLFKAEAPYVMLLLFVILIIKCKGMRLFFFSAFIIVFVLQILVKAVVYPAVGVKSYNVPFLYIVPLQQCARCAFYDKEMTDSEIEIIDKVWSYEGLKTNYNPTNADYILWACRGKESSIKDKLGWVGVWAKLVLRNPSTCIQATLNQYNGYFYFGEKPLDMYKYSHSALCMQNTAAAMEWTDYKFEYPMALQKWQSMFWDIQQFVVRFPILSVLMTPAFYFWGLVILWFHKFRKKNKRINVILVLTSITMLVCFTAPSSAYYGRYEYPVIMMFPLTLGIFLGLRNPGENDGVENGSNTNIRE